MEITMNTNQDALIAELGAAVERAKKFICPYCAFGDPISLDEDGVDRKGEYHSFYGGNRKCKAAFLWSVSPSSKGIPIRSDHTLEVIRQQPKIVSTLVASLGLIKT